MADCMTSWGDRDDLGHCSLVLTWHGKRSFPLTSLSFSLVTTFFYLPFAL